MFRFARDCLHAMNDLTNALEVSLWLGTGDLSMRIGLHSGPAKRSLLVLERTKANGDDSFDSRLSYECIV